MSQDASIRLQCLDMCKGDVVRAQRAHEWVTNGAALPVKESLVTVSDGRRISLRSDGTWVLMGYETP